MNDQPIRTAQRRLVAGSPWIVVAALVVLTFLYVWPGPLRFEHRFYGSGILWVKIDRLTRKATVFRYDPGNGKYAVFRDR